MRYRQLSNRAANETNTVIAAGYFITDLLLNYNFKKFEFTLSLENILNHQWNEAQFDTESKLKNETTAVSEIHFTPGSPRFFKFGAAFNF